MSVHILDSSALIAYLRAETGGSVVSNLLANATTDCYAHSINLCEVYYQSIRFANPTIASALIQSLYRDGLITRRDISQQFWKRVGQLKARGGIALPDCFCIALAQELGGEVVTTDHAEFDPLVPLGIVPIHFIR